MKKIHAKILNNDDNKLLTLYCKNKDIFIDVAITIPKNINTQKLEELLLLSCFKVIDPFIRCGIKFCVYSEYDFENILKNLKEKDHLNTELYVYANLEWINAFSLKFKQKNATHKDTSLLSFFYNKNTIAIYNKNVAELYEKEINKTLPFAIYERMRAKCDYAWMCSECPKGLNGECEALLYEEYAKTQNF